MGSSAEREPHSHEQDRIQATCSTQTFLPPFGATGLWTFTNQGTGLELLPLPHHPISSCLLPCDKVRGLQEPALPIIFGQSIPIYLLALLDPCPPHPSSSCPSHSLSTGRRSQMSTGPSLAALLAYWSRGTWTQDHKLCQPNRHPPAAGGPILSEKLCLPSRKQACGVIVTRFQHKQSLDFYNVQDPRHQGNRQDMMLTPLLL